MGLISQLAMDVAAVLEDSGQVIIFNMIEDTPILIPALHSRNNFTESSSIFVHLLWG